MTAINYSTAREMLAKLDSKEISARELLDSAEKMAGGAQHGFKPRLKRRGLVVARLGLRLRDLLHRGGDQLNEQLRQANLPPLSP